MSAKISVFELVVEGERFALASDTASLVQVATDSFEDQPWCIKNVNTGAVVITSHRR